LLKKKVIKNLDNVSFEEVPSEKNHFKGSNRDRVIDVTGYAVVKPLVREGINYWYVCVHVLNMLYV
jgi:hypothetical protein